MNPARIFSPFVTFKLTYAFMWEACVCVCGVWVCVCERERERERESESESNPFMYSICLPHCYKKVLLQY